MADTLFLIIKVIWTKKSPLSGHIFVGFFFWQKNGRPLQTALFAFVEGDI